MRILVIGRSGQLAHSLAREAAALGAQLSTAGRPEVDLALPATIVRSIEAFRPDVMINAAAYTAVDKAETEAAAAFAVNAGGASACAAAAADAGIPLIHVSTDYVFDGAKTGLYAEDDPTGPINVYGASKLEGERLVRRHCQRHVIVRTAWVISPFGSNFCKTMLRLAAERDTLRVVADQVGSPTYAIDLARGLLAICSRLMQAPGDDRNWGTYHVANSGTATWAEVAETVLAASARYGGRIVPIQPISTAEYPTPARRPGNSRLDCSKAARVFGVTLPPWREAVSRCVAELMAAQ